MHKSKHESDSSRKRRSFFSRTPLRALTPIRPDETSDNGSFSTKVLKKRRAAGMPTSQDPSNESPPITTHEETLPSPIVSESLHGGSFSRPASLMGSWKLSRSSESYEDNQLENSVSRSTIPETEDGEIRFAATELIVHHGEVQTSSSMFRKKREYLVLTESHLVRFKTQQKAAEKFPDVSPSIRRNSSARHVHSQSMSSTQEFASGASDHSGDRELGIPLRQIVATYRVDDGGRPYFAFEVASLDEKGTNAACMILQFAELGDMEKWLNLIRNTASHARLENPLPISVENSVYTAGVVETEADYDPLNFAVYSVVQRTSTKPGGRSSTDDLLKFSSTVCFLVIGAHKVHLIPLARSDQRSSTSGNISGTPVSKGIMCLTFLEASDSDDAFELTFRRPLQRQKVLHLASVSARDIAIRLRYFEELFRPEWENRPFKLLVPKMFQDDIHRNTNPQTVDLNSFERTLIAYCRAYDVDVRNITYRASEAPEDGPVFELLPPIDRRPGQYNEYELLAVMRSLRYIEMFKTLSFAGIHLDVLNGLHDRYGVEHVCAKTKRGTPICADFDELSRASLLVQEVRALAVTSRELRRLDFTSTILRKPLSREDSQNSDMGCGILEALAMVCKNMTTNVDWILLNNIQLGSTDLNYLTSVAVRRGCHFRGFGLSNTGLDSRGVIEVLEPLQAQEGTLEFLDLSRNIARLDPTQFDITMKSFPFMRSLNLTNLGRSTSTEPLLSASTLNTWRLSELILSHVHLNSASVDAIGCYLQNFKQSRGLRELRLDHTHLSGKEMAFLLHTMVQNPGEIREMHLDISQNNIEVGLVDLTKAIANGYAPSHLTLRLLEFEDEGAFRKLALAISSNATIRWLDISLVSLPSEASEATCQALEKMFLENKCLEFLDISGEESRLEVSRLGVGINRALCGLKENMSLRVLRIEHQNLGAQGASTLADVLKVNNVLLEVHCEHNGITLSSFTDLVNALHRNTSLLYLPYMDESRQMALRKSEDQVKRMRDEPTSAVTGKPQSVRTKLASKVGIIGTHGPKDKGSSSSTMSDQDIKAAMSLVDESWDRQAYRLKSYLERNHNLAIGEPTALDIDEEDFERPDSGSGSISKMIERAKLDSTPTMEKQINFGGAFVDTQRSSSTTSSHQRNDPEKDVPFVEETIFESSHQT